MECLATAFALSLSLPCHTFPTEENFTRAFCTWGESSRKMARAMAKINEWPRIHSKWVDGATIEHNAPRESSGWTIMNNSVHLEWFCDATNATAATTTSTALHCCSCCCCSYNILNGNRHCKSGQRMPIRSVWLTHECESICSSRRNLNPVHITCGYHSSQRARCSKTIKISKRDGTCQNDTHTQAHSPINLSQTIKLGTLPEEQRDSEAIELEKNSIHTHKKRHSIFISSTSRS